MNFKLTTRQLILCSLFTALTAVGAFIKIPVPVMPFTLQFLFTMLAGLILGPRLGAISVLVYAVLGLIGLPIFAEGGGVWYLMKPSFGYIIGFAAGAYVSGTIAWHELKVRGHFTMKNLVRANLTGLIAVYLIGMEYFYIICNYVIDTPIDISTLIWYCFVLAVPGDFCLCLLAAWLMIRLQRAVGGNMQ